MKQALIFVAVYISLPFFVYSQTVTDESIQSVSDYLKSDKIFIHVAETDGEILTIEGVEKGGEIKKYKLRMDSYKSFTYSAWSKPRVSALSVPYKIRPNSGSFTGFAQSGLKNAGINIELPGWFRQKLHPFGRKKQDAITGGILLAPAVIEIATENSISGSTAKSNQLFMSVGFTVSYSVNDFVFSIVPIGFDFAMNERGKDFAFNKKRWWGFGIGVPLTRLYPILKK